MFCTFFLASWETGCTAQTGPVREVRPESLEVTDLGRMWMMDCSQREGWTPGLNAPGAGRLGTPNLLVPSALTTW